MKAAQYNRLAIVLFLSIFMGLGSVAFADNKPYLKSFGADVRTGGWFDSVNKACSTSSSSNYQDSSFANSDFPLDANSVYNGGIVTYASQDSSGNPAGGSSSQYGALSLGAINGTGSPDGTGFYSAGALSASKNFLSFANTNASYPWGGVFEAGIRDLNSCIPDYYSTMDPANTSALPGNLRPLFQNGSSGGTFNATAAAGTSLDLFAGSGAGAMPAINPDKRIVIYVSGDVYISKNIVYDSSANVDHVPKFMLIVKGSIYVDPAVTQLDGFYIAQPASDTAIAVNSDTGIFWSCHPADTAKLDYTFAAQFCGSKLVINGAIVAKQVMFMRTNGDLGGSSRAEDALGNPKNNVAEVINYTPQMIVNGAFTITDPSLSRALPIDSIFSLPPAF